MARITVHAILETDALTDGPLLEKILKVAIEKVFFTECKVISLEVVRDEDSAIQTGTGKS